MNIAKMIHTYITDEAVEQKVIQAMNDAVDIPFINEKTEEGTNNNDTNNMYRKLSYR